MTATEFVEAIEAYYGTYASDYKRSMVAGYIGRYEPDMIRAIHDVIIDQFSDRYGKVPDVAAITEIRVKNKDELRKKAGQIYQQGDEVYRGERLIGHYDGAVFIPNLSEIQGTPSMIEYVEEMSTEMASPEKYAHFLSMRERAIVAQPDGAGR
jgi:hypothetical protein